MRINILLLLFCLTSISASAQWKVFKNLDFQHSVKDSLTGQAYWQSKADFQINEDFHDDLKSNTCLKLSGAYTPQKPAYLYQQHPVQVNESVLLRISALIKAENVSAGNASIYAYTKAGEQWLEYQRPRWAAIIGSEDWKSISLDIWVEPNAEILRIGASLTGKGSMWVDDFKIEVLNYHDCRLDDQYTAFMEECMNLISTNSLYKDSIDTSQLMQKWIKLAACQNTKEAMYKGLNDILDKVDNHSFHITASDVNAWQNTSSDPQADIPMSRGHKVNNTIAYIWMPYFGSGDSLSKVQFSTHMQQLIDSLDDQNVRAWVLDLRDNQGGNCWPMLAGIGPLLGEEVCGYFKEMGEYYPWHYSKGGSYNQDYLQTQIDTEPYQLFHKNPPVAVLTGPMTASSGEIVAVAFKNRPGSKSFGQKTAGYTTGNVNHLLSDGSMLFLAQNVYADRLKKAYLDGIDPDIPVAADKDTAEDEVLDAAIQWLSDQL